MQTTDHKKLKLVVSIALINQEEKVLITKRPSKKHLSGYWEFPGGKVEENETPERAIIREVYEELNININGKCIAPLCFSEYKYKSFNLLLLLYVCRSWEGSPESMEKNEIKWVKPNTLKNYKMPPADNNLIYSLLDLFYN